MNSKVYKSSDIRRTIWIMAGITAFMTMLFWVNHANYAGAVTGEEMAAAAEESVNTTLGDGMEYYAGCFSTMVTASVNPPVTLACIAILGTVERAEVYFPNIGWLVKLGNGMSKVPLLGTMRDLPIANPVAALILALAALALFIIRSIPESKAFTGWNVDQIEKYGGMIVTMGMALLPLATTEKLYAATENLSVMAAKWYVTPKTYAILAVVGVVVTIVGGVVYFLVSTCANSLETVASLIPVPGVSFVYQIGETVLAVLLMALNVIAPVLAVIVSLLLVILAIILLPKVTLLATYYNYVYMKPAGKYLFHRHEDTGLIHDKFPSKGRKLFPDASLAIPVFTMKPIHFRDLPLNQGGKLKKRQLAWLLIKDETPYLVRIKTFRKTVEIPLHDMLANGKTLYLEKRKRFMKVICEDRTVELIISNEYAGQMDTIMELLKLEDYRVLGKPATEQSDRFDTAEE